MSDVAHHIDFVPRGAVLLCRAAGSLQAWHGASDASRGSALQSALAAATAGDVVRLGPGVFNIGSSQLLLPDQVALFGSGAAQTRIVGDTVSVMLTMQADNTIADLSLTVENADQSGGAVQSGPGGVVRNCQFTAYGPAIWGPDGGACRVYQSTLEAELVVVQSIAAGELDLHACQLSLQFSSETALGSGVRPIAAGAIVRIFGGQISVGHASGRGVYTTGGEAELFGARITNSGAGFDLYRHSGAIRLAACVFDPAKTSGALTQLDVLGGRTPGALGLDLLDDGDAATARATLGLNTAATSPASAFATATHAHSAADLTSGTVSLARLPAAAFPTGCICWMDEASMVVGARTISPLSTQIYGYHAYDPAGGNGVSWTHRVFLAAGTYEFATLGIAGPDRAKIDWSIDGGVPFATQDWYHPTPSQVNTTKTNSVTIATSGWHKLTGTVNGRNAANTASPGHYYSLTKSWFKPTSD